eukprot:TRINITY_DN31295_c0_g1_i1.p1 TRINITY_DN31295_c0_g1~~TRINITY_DN31295_c0_g1_i1.p1  ORF type:complete len:686 (+),score=102.07 TRINITY_DN31295_c0_g1_i1:72-2060(+)
MLASALRSLVVNECGDDLSSDGGIGSKGSSSAPLRTVPLDGTAVALDWDTNSSRVVLATSRGTGADTVAFVRASSVAGSVEERLTLPAACGGATDLSVSCRPSDLGGASWAAVACGDGTIQLIDCCKHPAKIAHTRRHYGSAATAVHVSQDLQSIASGSANGDVFVQSFAEAQGPARLSGIADDVEVTCVRFSPLRPNVLAACDASGALHVWDTNTLSSLCRFPEAHRGSANGLSFSAHNHSLLISAGHDSQLVFWDVTNGTQIRQVPAETPLTSISYHRDGYLVATGTDKGTVLLFDLRMLVSKSQPAVPSRRYTEHQERGVNGAITALAFGPQGSSLSRPRSSDRSNVAAANLGSYQGSSSNLLAEGKQRPQAEHGFAPSAAANGDLAMAGAAAAAAATVARAAASASASSIADPASGPTAASLQSMFNRLSTRNSLTGGAGASRGSSSGGTAADFVPQSRVSGPPPSASQNAGNDVPTGQQVDRLSSGRGASALAAAIGDRMESSTGYGAADTGACVGDPSTAGTLDRNSQAHPMRYSIGSSAEQQVSKPTNSQWWSRRLEAEDAQRQLLVEDGDAGYGFSQEAGDAATAPSVLGASTEALTEALRPLFAELRRDLSREVRESQCALLEQNFRMHAELRRDVEELRTEVQQLRGELRVL